MFKVPCTCDAGATEPFRKRIEYDVVDLTTNPAALEYVMEELGYSAAPSSSPAIRTTGRDSAPTSSTSTPHERRDPER